MKKKTIIIIVGLIVIMVTVGFVYYRHISSPEYSLGQIKQAYDQHDITKFEKYVDTKTLIGGILDKTLNEASERSTASSSAERLGENLGKGLINLMRPQVEELWTQQINKLVETGDIQGGNEKKGLDEIWNKSDTASFKGIKEIKIDGKVATVFLEFNQPRFDTTLVLNIKMRDKGSYWQLFDISNIFEYSKTIESLEEERVNKLNEEVLRQFLTHVKMSDVKLQTKTKGGYYTTWYGHTYTIDFENIGTREIEHLTCFFDIKSASGQKLESAYLSKRFINLKPGEKYQHKEEDPLSYDKVDTNGLFVDFDLVGVDFKDGSRLVWQYEWADLQEKK